MPITNTIDLDLITNSTVFHTQLKMALRQVGLARLAGTLVVETSETATALEKAMAQRESNIITGILQQQGITVNNNMPAMTMPGQDTSRELKDFATMLVSSAAWTLSLDDWRAEVAAGTAGASVAGAVAALFASLATVPGS
ncbi:MAG: hypothetical protein KDE24_23650 [Caldilinea sp.]|nr:hypothetical protein [Caldilinea sp.]